MAVKKFKSDVQLEQGISFPNKTTDRALVIDGSGNLVESTVTTTELDYMSGVTSSVQTQMSSKADLVGGKIPTAQLPALAITEVFTAADIAARDVLTIGTGDGEIQEGDVVIVTDASADAAITAGSASYIYNGSSYSLLKSGDEVLSVAGKTGAVTLAAADITDFDTEVSNNTSVAANTAKISADNSVTTHNDVTNAGSGAIITGTERTTLGTALQPADASTNLNHTQTTPTDWTVASGADVGAHLDEAGSRIKTLEASSETITGGAGLTRTGDDLSVNVDNATLEINVDTLRVKAGGIQGPQIGNDEVGTTKLQDEAVTTLKIADGNVTTIKLQNDSVTEAKIQLSNASFMQALNFAAASTNVIGLNASDKIVFGSLPQDATVPSVDADLSNKKYVDDSIAAIPSGSPGDIDETSFVGAADTATSLPITGLAFANILVRAFDVQLSVEIDATTNLYETFRLMGVQKGASWDMVVESVGDDSTISFDITPLGQIQYTKLTTAGWVSTNIKFRATTTTKA